MTKKESYSDEEHSNSDYSDDECEHKKLCKKCEKKRKEKSKKCGKCEKQEKHKVETIKDVKCKTEGQNIVITIKQCCP